MKRGFRTFISSLLIASLCIGLLSATALAADPAGTVEDPTVTEKVTTDFQPDTPAPRPDHDDHHDGEDVGGPRRHRGKRNDCQG